MSSLNSHLRTRRFSEVTFRPSRHRKHWKTQHFATSLTFRACWSSFFPHLLIFFLAALLFQLSILSEVRLLNFLWQYFALRLSFQISPNAAPATKSDSSTSPNTAPATKNESHDWSLSHMKRYLQCAEQQVSLSKLTKYCACHARWPSWSILFTHETLFTMRGVTSVIVQTHQILRLPRKMNLMIDPCHTWNSIYNARSNKCHCPNSPNTAPATQNDSPKFCKNFSKTAETSFPMRGRSEHDPSRIREWNRHSATRLASEVTFHAHHEHFVLKNTSSTAQGGGGSFKNRTL